MIRNLDSDTEIKSFPYPLIRILNVISRMEILMFTWLSFWRFKLLEDRAETLNDYHVDSKKVIASIFSCLKIIKKNFKSKI